MFSFWFSVIFHMEEGKDNVLNWFPCSAASIVPITVRSRSQWWCSHIIILLTFWLCIILSAFVFYLCRFSVLEVSYLVNIDWKKYCSSFVLMSVINGSDTDVVRCLTDFCFLFVCIYKMYKNTTFHKRQWFESFNEVQLAASYSQLRRRFLFFMKAWTWRGSTALAQWPPSLKCEPTITPFASM